MYCLCDNDQKLKNNNKRLVLGRFCNKLSQCGGVCSCRIIPEKIMLERFEQYLVNNGSIGSKQIPYYIKWVLDCYTFLNCGLETILSSEKRKQYLEYLTKVRDDWQVKQAD